MEIKIIKMFSVSQPLTVSVKGNLELNSSLNYAATVWAYCEILGNRSQD